MMLGTMRLVVLRAVPLVKGYGANLAVKCDGVLAFVEAQYNLALCSRAARTRSVRGSIPVALPTSVSTRPDNHLRARSRAGGRDRAAAWRAIPASATTAPASPGETHPPSLNGEWRRVLFARSFWNAKVFERTGSPNQPADRQPFADSGLR